MEDTLMIDALQKEQNCKGGYDIFDIMLKR